MILGRLALSIIAAPRRILILVALATVAVAIVGLPVAKSLSAGGYQDPNSESAQANALLAEKFDTGDMPMLLLVTAQEGADSEAARSVATDIVGELESSPHVATVASAWTSPPPAAAELTSRDGKSGLIVAGITGGENDAQHRAEALANELAGDRGGVTVQAGGLAIVYSQIRAQAQHDLLVMELIAVPLSFLVLIWAFGGLVAAALPVLVGLVAILGSLFVLRLVAMGTDVSIFALNLIAATGLALGIDYTLLIINRYRFELAEGRDPGRALVQTMATAGRTVIFSATIVLLAFATMALFPVYFLRTFAYAGVATVALTALAAMIIAPAAIAVLGPRINAFDVRRLLGRRQNMPVKPEQMFWYRWTKFVMRHAIPLGLAVVVLLLVLGAPFLGVKWGFRDDRTLPQDASAHEVGDRLRSEFADNSSTAVRIVLPDAAQLTSGDIDVYAAELSRVPDVRAVSAPTGTFAAGAYVGAPTAPAGANSDSVFLSVSSDAPLYTEQSENQLTRLHEVSPPGGREVLMTGIAQINRDSVGAVTSQLPLVFGFIGAVTLALMFLLTGSVAMPIKTLLLNVLSLTAAFGAMVWIFQEGHFGGLGTASTGTLEITMPVLLFCIAFGLSMDYEVFLVSRIREYWLASRSQANPLGDNDESVALGIAQTGRVVTAAALIMAIAFAALIASEVAFVRMFGLGLTLAVLVDATLVRMVLVPSFMHLLGRWNWWAPPPLKWLHDRIGISESPGAVSGHKPSRHRRQTALGRILQKPREATQE